MYIYIMYIYIYIERERERYIYMCVCVCACVRVHVRACVCVCVLATLRSKENAAEVRSNNSKRKLYKKTLKENSSSSVRRASRPRRSGSPSRR